MASYYTDKLVAKLKALGQVLPDDVEIRRLQPGPGARAMGSWSWCFRSHSRPLVNCVGSRWTVQALARADSLDIVLVDQNYHLYPVNDGMQT